MKIDELIQELEEVNEEHGNLEAFGHRHIKGNRKDSLFEDCIQLIFFNCD